MRLKSRYSSIYGKLLAILLYNSLKNKAFNSVWKLIDDLESDVFNRNRSDMKFSTHKIFNKLQLNKLYSYFALYADQVMINLYTAQSMFFSSWEETGKPSGNPGESFSIDYHNKILCNVIK